MDLKSERASILESFLGSKTETKTWKKIKLKTSPFFEIQLQSVTQLEIVISIRTRQTQSILKINIIPPNRSLHLKTCPIR